MFDSSIRLLDSPLIQLLTAAALVSTLTLSCVVILS